MVLNRRVLKELKSPRLRNQVWSLILFPKDQENPNFSAFGTLGSLSNDPHCEKYLGCYVERTARSVTLTEIIDSHA